MHIAQICVYTKQKHTSNQW